jgi:hypothetical protein
MLATARELAFRIAVTSANPLSEDDLQKADATIQRNIIVYSTNFQIMGIALLLTLLPAIAVFSTLLGWWELGRDVTLNPIETAKAFDAPALDGVNSNATVMAMLKDVGDRPLQYGAFGFEARNKDEVAGHPNTKLLIGFPREVRKPWKGETFPNLLASRIKNE